MQPFRSANANTMLPYCLRKLEHMFRYDDKYQAIELAFTVYYALLAGYKYIRRYSPSAVGARLDSLFTAHGNFLRRGNDINFSYFLEVLSPGYRNFSLREEAEGYRPSLLDVYILNSLHTDLICLSLGDRLVRHNGRLFQFRSGAVRDVYVVGFTPDLRVALPDGSYDYIPAGDKYLRVKHDKKGLPSHVQGTLNRLRQDNAGFFEVGSSQSVFDRKFVTPQVLKLVEEIDPCGHTADPTLLAVLADALEEAGCTNPNHLLPLRGWHICPSRFRYGAGYTMPFIDRSRNHRITSDDEACLCGYHDGWLPPVPGAPIPLMLPILRALYVERYGLVNDWADGYF